MSDPTQTLGKYQIIREIARSNDIVYEAYDPLMNRRVALKELAMPGGLNANQQEDRRNRFLREARAAGTLTHPNIVTVYEYGEDSNRHYIAMEFLDGHTLRNEIDTHGFLPLDRSLEIGKAVLDALEYAHKNGVIHRDIKPENIQLMGDGRIKITDFGIARLTFEPNITMDGQVFGTPSYMSPEQVVGKEIDARSDLFSLGVVLYEMVGGQKPFTGDSVVSITYAIMNSEPHQPAQANYAIWQVLQRALDKSPALRYAGAHEMKLALEEAEAASFSNSPVLDPMTSGNPYGGYNAGAMQNPYAPPQFQVGNAPPAGNPYLYNPYQPQPYSPSGSTPYQTQPPSYTFNPYQSPPPGMPPMSSPGYPPIPVYYPPPPRPPLITPEVKSVTGRVFAAFLILGTIIALAIVAAKYFSVAVERYQVDQSNRAAVTRPFSRPRANAGRATPAPGTHRPAEQHTETVPVEPDPPVVSPPVEQTPVMAYDPEAGRAYWEQAIQLMAENRMAEARIALYEARKRYPPDSEEYAAVQQMIDGIS